jgi:hypothetical protein
MLEQPGLELYAISTLVTFCSVFLKGFQHKNVIGGHLKLIAVTSYAMAVFDVAAVMVIYKGGWWMTLSSGTGAAIGMVLAIVFHDRLFNKTA